MPEDSADSKINSPAATILSLFANKIIFPVFDAIAVASRPANPVIAETIISILSSLIKALRSGLPFKTLLLI